MSFNCGCKNVKFESKSGCSRLASQVNCAKRVNEMKFFYTLILISLSINAEPVRVEKSGIEKFGCTYKNLDYFSKENINPDRVIYSQPFMNKITDKAGELYNYLTKRVSNYHLLVSHQVITLDIPLKNHFLNIRVQK